MADNVGNFADVVRAREDALASRLIESAAADQQFQEMLRQAVTANAGYRQQLDAIEAEIRESAASWPGLDTPGSSRQFQQFLNDKTRQIHQLVTAAAADSQQRAQQVTALTDRYQLTGFGTGPQGPLSPDPVPGD